MPIQKSFRIIKAFGKICFNTPFLITPSSSVCLSSCCCLSLEPSRGLFQAAALPFLSSPVPFRRGALGTCGSAGCSHCPRVTHQPEGPGARPGAAPLLWLPAASRSACKCDLWPQPLHRRNFHSSRRRQNSGSRDVKGYLIQGGWSGGLFCVKANPSASQWGKCREDFKVSGVFPCSYGLVKFVFSSSGTRVVHSGRSLAVGHLQRYKVTQNCSCTCVFAARKF